jgi:hypothetical protein
MGIHVPIATKAHLKASRDASHLCSSATTFIIGTHFSAADNAFDASKSIPARFASSIFSTSNFRTAFVTAIL